MASEREETEVVGFSRPDALALLSGIGLGLTRAPTIKGGTHKVVMMVVTQVITAKSSTTVGKGKANYYYIDADDKFTVVPNTNEDVYNLGAATGAVGKTIVAIREDASGKLIWIYEDCS